MQELFFAFLTTRREHSDPIVCKETLVGPMRTYLAVFGALGLMTEFPDMPAPIATIVKGRHIAGKQMTEFCWRCGRCDWGDKR